VFHLLGVPARGDRVQNGGMGLLDRAPVRSSDAASSFRRCFTRSENGFSSAWVVSVMG
jgi:hypothetical protein